MTATTPTHDSDCRTNCIQCGDALIVPERTECAGERLVLNHWFCSKCGCRFETEAAMPAADQTAIDPTIVEAFFPSLLVA